MHDINMSEVTDEFARCYFERQQEMTTEGV